MPPSTDFHAQIALWRAERWTNWLPAMAAGPAMAVTASSSAELISRWLYIQRNPAFPISMQWLAFLTPIFASLLAFLAICALAWLIRLATPRIARTRSLHAWLSFVKLNGIFAILVSITFYLVMPAAVIAFQFIEPLPDNGRRPFATVAFLFAHLGTICVATWLAFRTRNRAITCARCSYAMSSRFKSAPNCPECNNPWKLLRGTSFGRRLPIWLPLTGTLIYLSATILGAAVI